MKPDDILLWQDGFWCFREESARVFLRNQYYRVIPCASDEGQKILAAGPALRLRAAKIEPNLHFTEHQHQTISARPA